MNDVTPSETRKNSTSIVALVLRIFWMVLGNGALGISGYQMFRNRVTIFSAADIVFWVTVLLLITARYVDISRYEGYTADGEPATMSHWRRYAVTLAVGASAAWVAVHGISRLLS